MSAGVKSRQILAIEILQAGVTESRGRRWADASKVLHGTCYES